MAGDWIKMRIDLATSPKVVRIASALRADRLRVIGGLHAVWCLFDMHSEDGQLDGYTLEALDELIGFEGFGAAMLAVGWLLDDGKSLCTPRFEEHNGQSAKRRAMETERKRESRKVSAPHADEKRSREEKRREEKNKNKDTHTVEGEQGEHSRTTQAGAVCVVLKSEGISSVNPSHPELIALLTAGAQVGQFAEAAKVAVKKGKGFAYALGIVKGQMGDAEKLAITQQTPSTPISGNSRQPLSFAERDRIAGMQRWEEGSNQRHPELPEEFSKFRSAGNVIDITPNDVRIAQ